MRRKEELNEGGYKGLFVGQDESFCYNNLFTEGINGINTAEILLNGRNPKSAFSYIKEAIEKYYTGYIFYKGCRAKNIHGINGPKIKQLGYNMVCVSEIGCSQTADLEFSLIALNKYLNKRENYNGI